MRTLLLFAMLFFIAPEDHTPQQAVELASDLDVWVWYNGVVWNNKFWPGGWYQPDVAGAGWYLKGWGPGTFPGVPVK